MFNQKRCDHLEKIEISLPDKYECEECIKTGDRWLHLRKCQTCGITLCCDSSPNKHASAHYNASQHPVIISAEPGERWAFCYPDQLFINDFYLET